MLPEPSVILKWSLPMRLPAALCLGLLSTPVLADTRVQVSPASTEASGDAAALVEAMTAELAGARKGCPVTLGEAGDLMIAVTHVVGPPEGWSLAMGPAEAPTFTTTGVAGEVAAAAAAILEKLCPKQGGAATVGPWTASGGGAQLSVTGEVKDLVAPFTLQGEFPGGQAVFEYTPVNIGGGAVSYTLSGSGVTGSGEGMYSLAEQGNGVYLLEQTTDGCVDGIPNSCRTNNDTITLTPVGQ